MVLGLTRDQRIRTPREIKELFRCGKRMQGASLTLWSRPISSKATGASQAARLGVTVSQKISRNATERNLWKRRIRESFRKNQHQIANGLGFMVRASRPGPAPDYGLLEKELLELLKKSGALR